MRYLSLGTPSLTAKKDQVGNSVFEISHSRKSDFAIWLIFATPAADSTSSLCPATSNIFGERGRKKCSRKRSGRRNSSSSARRIPHLIPRSPVHILAICRCMHGQACIRGGIERSESLTMNPFFSRQSRSSDVQPLPRLDS